MYECTQILVLKPYFNNLLISIEENSLAVSHPALHIQVLTVIPAKPVKTWALIECATSLLNMDRKNTARLTKKNPHKYILLKIICYKCKFIIIKMTGACVH